MTDAFSDREKGFERKFQLDQEQQFKVTVARDRLLGQWIAGKFGLTGAAAATYAEEVVASNFEKPGDADMLAKVRKDIAARKVVVTDEELGKKLAECEAQAVKQITGM